MATVSSISSDQTREVLNNYYEKRNIVNEFLNGHELAMLKVLNLLDRVRQKWACEVKENAQLREEVKLLENQISVLDQERSSLTEQLRHARAQIAACISEKEELKSGYCDIRKRFQLAEQLLKGHSSQLSDDEQIRLAFLDGMKLSPKNPASFPAEVPGFTSIDEDCVDYDKTDDILEHPLLHDVNVDEGRLRSGRIFRRSQMNSVPGGSKRAKIGEENFPICTVNKDLNLCNETPAKRLKQSSLAATNTFITTATTTVDSENHDPSNVKTATRRSMNRSFSESDLRLSEKREKSKKVQSNDGGLANQGGISSFLDIRTPIVLSYGWSKASSVEQRGHTLTNYTSIIGDKCDVCNRWIGIGGKPACKCNDCNLHIHKSCVSKAPMPCVPYVPMPRTPGKQRPRLKDFCPTSHPMIPHLIIHCVMALDNYYLDSEGLYRIPGQETQISKLFNEFNNPRFQPKLRFQDPETITGCIKRFLKHLRDYLIPSSSWDEFVNAAKEEDQEAIDRCVNDLPAPNKDTLAFLCDHFQKVCEHSALNKMAPEVLARSVAPTIVGRAPMRTANLAQGSDEVAKQVRVMTVLLKMPRGYWGKFYSCDGLASSHTPAANVFTPSAKQRVANRKHYSGIRHRFGVSNDSLLSPADCSILGPIRTPPSSFNRKPHSVYRRKNVCLNPY